MPELEARTDVHRPPDVVFDALLDLRRYESYSDYLASVRRDGDGGIGTTYTLQFTWWLVSYTVRSRVTGVTRPERLDFEVIDGIAADGSWFVEPLGEHADADEPWSRVRFVVSYDPNSVTSTALQLPAIASMSWVIDRAAPLVEREAEGVVQRVVRDLEGDDRTVDLEVCVR